VYKILVGKFELKIQAERNVIVRRAILKELG
jgi:hypothetical protein